MNANVLEAENNSMTANTIRKINTTQYVLSMYLSFCLIMSMPRGEDMGTMYYVWDYKLRTAFMNCSPRSS